MDTSRSQLDRFCALVLADMSLQQRLRQPDAIDPFIALVLDTAREYGFEFSAETVRGAMHGRLPGEQFLIGTGIVETTPPPKGWLPTATSWQQSELYLHWSYFGDARLREPFFEGDVQRCMFKPFNRLFRHTTPIAKLAGWLEAHPPLPPRGFIFHMSRCGSTLVSQMLAALARNVVISEASPIDDVVRARQMRPDLGPEQHALWLRSMIGALGQMRSGDESNYFIKLDCWHTLALPLFRRAFPDVPWVFLYRDPVEVMVSQRRMPGMQMIPGMLDAGVLGVEPSDRPPTPEQHCARVLTRICEPVLQDYSKDEGLLVNYRQLPEAVWTTILPHFGIECSEADCAAMVAAAQFDAKMPSAPFTPDIDSKQQDATETLRAAANERLGDIYRQFEALRHED